MEATPTPTPTPEDHGIVIPTPEDVARRNAERRTWDRPGR